MLQVSFQCHFLLIELFNFWSDVFEVCCMQAFLNRWLVEYLIVDLAVNIVNVVFWDITLGSKSKKLFKGEFFVLLILLIEFVKKAVGSTDCFVNISEIISLHFAEHGTQDVWWRLGSNKLQWDLSSSVGDVVDEFVETKTSLDNINLKISDIIGEGLILLVVVVDISWLIVELWISRQRNWDSQFMPLLLDVFLAGSTKVIEDIVGQEENCELLLPLILIISNIILNRLRLPDILFKVFSQKH